MVKSQMVVMPLEIYRVYQLHLHNHKIRSYGDGLIWMILSHLQKIPPQKKKTIHEASVQAPSAVQKMRENIKRFPTT